MYMIQQEQKDRTENISILIVTLCMHVLESSTKAEGKEN